MGMGEYLKVTVRTFYTEMSIYMAKSYDEFKPKFLSINQFDKKGNINERNFTRQLIHPELQNHIEIFTVSIASVPLANVFAISAR
jgi:hypothetical protein